MKNHFKRKYSDIWPKDETIYGPLSGKKIYYDVSFAKAELKANSFARLELNGFDFSGADLRGTSFHESKLKKIEFYEIYIQDQLIFWCKWYRKIKSNKISRAETFDLWFLSLVYCLIFGKTDLRNVSFRKATLEHVRLSRSDLRGVSFQGAKLKHVEVDDVKTGITQSQRNFIFLVACIISLLSGVIISYSLGLNLVDLFASQEQIGSAGKNAVWWLIWITFPVLFGLAAFFSFSEGMSSSFPAFFLIATILSFVIIIPAPGEHYVFIGLIVFGLISYVGLSVGVFAQSQSTYAVYEASYLSDCQNEGLKAQLFFTYGITVLGILLGTWAAIFPDQEKWEHTNILFVCAVFLLTAGLVTFLGNLFGLKAYEEKEKYRTDSGKTPYVISIPEATKYFHDQGSGKSDSGQEDFVKETIKEQNSLKNFKFSIVRFLADLQFDRVKTSFSGSEIVGVNFSDINLNRCDFSPLILDISDSINNPKDLNPVRQAVSSGKSIVINTTYNIINSVLNNSVFKEFIDLMASIDLDDAKLYTQNDLPPLQSRGDDAEMSENSININNKTNVVRSKIADSDIGNIEIKIGNNPDASQKAKDLIKSIKDRLNQFPHEPKEDADEELDHLKHELQKEPSQQNPRKVRKYLNRMLAACGAALALIIPSLEYSTEVFTHLNKVSAESVEFIQNSQALQQAFNSIEGAPMMLKALTASGEQPVFETIKETSGQISELYELIEPSQTETLEK